MSIYEFTMATNGVRVFLVYAFAAVGGARAVYRSKLSSYFSYSTVYS